MRQGWQKPLLLGLFLFGFSIGVARADAPAWYRRKKNVEAEQKREEAEKAAEKPIVGGPESTIPKFSTLSAPEGPPPSTNRLFAKDGATESIGFELGRLNQPIIAGQSYTLSYAFGWWWTPRLTIGPTLKATGIIDTTYGYMLVHLGPQTRWFLSKRWNLTGFALFGVSRGLSRVEQSHIPNPPDTVALRARRGLTVGAQVTHLFWLSRGFSVGPTLGYWRGSQSDRSWSMVTLGVTYQSGRPDYAGSVIDDWVKY